MRDKKIVVLIVLFLTMTPLLGKASRLEANPQKSSYFEKAQAFVLDHIAAIGSGLAVVGIYCYLKSRATQNGMPSPSAMLPNRMAAVARKLNFPPAKQPIAALAKDLPKSFEQRIYALWASASSDFLGMVQQFSSMPKDELAKAARMSVFWELLARNDRQILLDALGTERLNILLDALESQLIEQKLDEAQALSRIDAIVAAFECANLESPQQAWLLLESIERLRQIKENLQRGGLRFPNTNGFSIDNISFRISVAMAPIQHSFAGDEPLITRVKEIRKSLIYRR